MKKTLLLIIFITGLTSCFKDEANLDRKLSKMKSPVIVIAVDSINENIMLKDSTGKIVTFCKSKRITSILLTKNVGDTIK